VKRKYFRIGALMLASVMLVTLLAGYALACSFVYLEPSLPTTQAMRNVELEVPLRIYTRSGGLIAQIGEQRRIPVTWNQIPDVIKHAFLAAEDDRFFEHHGIDYLGVVRAVLVDLVSGEKAQGASTITQQAARNMFLTLDKTAKRKLQEMFVTYEMEHEFTKQEIFSLYLNKIFFGQRAYGVAAAAEAFYGKPLNELTVSEAATIAGVPKAPSKYNPIANPQLAAGRRSYVLRRMRELRYIDAATADAANKEPVQARQHAPLNDVEAPYVAEMARLEVRQRFGAAAENSGYKVYTTIDNRLQEAANRALRIGLIEYDRRHGWRGPIGHVELAAGANDARLEDLVSEYSSVGDLVPAVVTSVAEKSARAYVKARGLAQIDWDGLSWARKDLGNDTLGPVPKAASEVLSRGDVVYVVAGNGVAQLGQVPEAQSALVALDPHDGGVAALVGGFDYFTNKYNRATQAKRQPGSGFKPFLYSGALENGFTPASVILDAPVVNEGPDIEESWRPKNDGGKFHGPTRLREALVHSRNLVSIRLLRDLGPPYAIDYATRFGFDKRVLPNNLTLALGTLPATPLELASAYAVFANGGFRVEPYYIDRIENAAGQIVWQAAPKIACEQCERPPVGLGDVLLSGDPVEALKNADSVRGGEGALPKQQLAPRVITPQNDYIMTDMMTDVIKRGTAVRALALKRGDIAGKTGTTNQSKDNWFNGFTPNLEATVWVGFDQERSLGATEEGARTALPIWIHFMREALKGVPEYRRPMPDGIVTLRVSTDTGTLISNENPDGMSELFLADHLPAAREAGPVSTPGAEGAAASTGTIF
jgi:penicillin-binding protein 1A